jgi:hypothetical protein
MSTQETAPTGVAGVTVPPATPAPEPVPQSAAADGILATDTATPKLRSRTMTPIDGC